MQTWSDWAGAGGARQRPGRRAQTDPISSPSRQQPSQPGGGKTRVPASAPHPAPRVHLPGVPAPPPSFPSSHRGHLRPRPVGALPQRLHSRPQAGTSTKVPAPAPHPGCGEGLGSPAPRGQLRCEARGPRNPGRWNPGMAGTTAPSPRRSITSSPAGAQPGGAGLGAGRWGPGSRV